MRRRVVVVGVRRGRCWRVRMSLWRYLQSVVAVEAPRHFREVAAEALAELLD